MNDEQFQIIDKIIDENIIKITKLEEKNLDEYWYKEEKLRRSLADLYYQRIHISHGWQNVYGMIRDFYRMSQYFNEVLDYDSKLYDSHIEYLLQMIQTYRANGDNYESNTLYDELFEIKKQKKTMIERINADVENECVTRYDRIIEEINEITEQLKKNELEIKQIEYQLEEIRMKKSKVSETIESLKRENAKFSTPILSDVERILKELKSRVSESDDYLNN